MNMPCFHVYSNQRGSAFFVVLIAVVLFAALSFALSRGDNAAQSIGTERLRLLAGDVMDMGNKLADATSRLRLRQVSDTQISFENMVVAGYTNASCTTDSCKVFAFDGGGKDWETPTKDISIATEWGFTGDLAVEGMGTAEADLVAVLPNLSFDLCDRINMVAGNYTVSGSIISFLSITANKFTGTYAVGPVLLSGAGITGQKSGCIQASAANGTAFAGAPIADAHIFYQVLEAR